MPPAVNPDTIRWTAGRWLADHPETGERIDLHAEPEPALPRAARDALDADPALTREQAAAWLGVTPATLAQWVVRGEGPGFASYGRGVVYLLSELVRWRAEQAAKPRPEPAPEPAKRGRGRPRGT